jgi:hypothetical protein
MKDQYTFMRKKRFKLHWKLCCLLCLASLLSLNVQAQAPNQFSFQGVARDATGKVIANGNVTLWIKIRSTPDQGGIIEEIHETNTNGIGIFTIQIGGAGGDLTNVDWNKGTYFLNINIDPTGGNDISDYIDLGSTQLLSVPYALMANKLPDLDPISQIGLFNQGKVLNTFSTAPSLIWYPRKDAFKVGMGTADDANSLGEHSVALGHYTIAPGHFATALGSGTTANVDAGTVLGRYNDIQVPEELGGNLDDRLFQIGNGTSQKRSNALTMMGNGKIGIGTNVLNPNYLLDIGGRIRIRHNANGNTAGIYFDAAEKTERGFVGMKAEKSIGFWVDGAWRFWVDHEGDCFVGGEILTQSDRRLKRDFSPLSNSLSKLTNLTGQHYFWKDTTKSQALQTGLIAQEVEQYFPELVTKDDKGFKAVNYIGLIPHLIESVKTLKAQTEVIGALEKQMQELRAEVNSMKNVNSDNLKQTSK